MAFETLKSNLIDKCSHFEWPSWLESSHHDIRKILRDHETDLRKLRGTIQLVAGGPPCCGFSMAGLRREDDERNTLVESYLQFVEIVQPEAVLFENVRGFTLPFQANATNGKAYSTVVVKRLQELGYSDVCGELLDLSKFGVPQRRTRFILVGTRSKKAHLFFDTLKFTRTEFLRAKGLASRNAARTAISDLERASGTCSCPDSIGFRSGRYAQSRNNFQRLMRAGIDATKLPNSHRFAEHTAPVKKVFRSLIRNAPRDKSIGGKDREKYGLKKRSVTVIDAAKPSPTITTIPDDYIHYSEPRVMTVRECARLQSFPDWFEFLGRYTTGGKKRTSEVPRYTQVGNAIPPLFGELAGTVLKSILSDD